MSRSKDVKCSRNDDMKIILNRHSSGRYTCGKSQSINDRVAWEIRELGTNKTRSKRE